MKSILDNLITNQTSNYLTPVTLTVMRPELIESGPMNMPFELSKEYESRLVVGHRFKSTDKNYAHAAAQSKKMIARHLYADVIYVVDEIMSATYAGDAEAILSLCSALKKDLLNIGA